MAKLATLAYLPNLGISDIVNFLADRTFFLAILDFLALFTTEVFLTIVAVLATVVILAVQDSLGILAFLATMATLSILSILAIFT